MTVETIQEEKPATAEKLDLLIELVSSLRKDMDAIQRRLDRVEQGRIDAIWQNICAHQPDARLRIAMLECAIGAIESMEKSKADPSRIMTGAEMRERMAARGIVLGNAL